MDDLVLQLRQLVDTDPSEAACIFVQAKSILDETDRLISSKLPITSSFVQQQQQQPTNATSSATVLPKNEAAWRQSRMALMKRNFCRNRILPEKTVQSFHLFFFCLNYCYHLEVVLQTTTMRFTTFADVEDAAVEKDGGQQDISNKNYFFPHLRHAFKKFKERDKAKQFSSQDFLGKKNENNEDGKRTGDDVRDLWKTQVVVLICFAKL